MGEELRNTLPLNENMTYHTRTSGAMYSGVPHAVLQPDPKFSALLYPKSHSLTMGSAPPRWSISTLSSCMQVRSWSVIVSSSASVRSC